MASMNSSKQHVHENNLMRVLISGKFPLLSNASTEDLIIDDKEIEVIAYFPSSNNAITFAKLIKPDLIILAIDHNGEFDKDEVLELKTNCECHIIATTSNPNTRIIKQLIQARTFQGYLTPEISKEELALAIKHACSHKTYYSQAIVKHMATCIEEGEPQKLIPQTDPDRYFSVAKLEQLTIFELCTLISITKGQSHAQISRKLGERPNATARYQRNICTKLHIPPTQKLRHLAQKHKLHIQNSAYRVL